MTTKTDLIEAQNYSRRRLVTAFVSGAPAGRELEPARPLRAVVIALVLTAAVVLGGAFYGLVQPGLPQGWQNGRLVIAKDTGARYVTANGVLRPVINTASARLLTPSADFSVITTSAKSLAGISVGQPVGIIGAPDTLPPADGLVNNGWTACIADDGGTDVRIQRSPAAVATAKASVVENGGRRWLVAGSLRYAVDSDHTDAVLRAAGINALSPVTVPTNWLNLFSPGTPLAPILVDNTGRPVPGSSLLTGDVVHITGNPAQERFLVQSDGSLAALTPLAWQLYELGSGRNTDAVKDVPAAAIAALPTAKAKAVGADWPQMGFTSITTDERACAILQHDATGQPQTVLATGSTATPDRSGIEVTAGLGALVRAQGRGDQGAGMVTLIDATGTAYAAPGASDETIKRLGYATNDVGSAGEGWLSLLHSGPALTSDAAGREPGSATTP